MTREAYLNRVCELFTDYEKAMMQIKRKQFEQQNDIRFVNLQAYVSYLFDQIPHKTVR